MRIPAIFSSSSSSSSSAIASTRCLLSSSSSSARGRSPLHRFPASLRFTSSSLPSCSCSCSCSSSRCRYTPFASSPSSTSCAPCCWYESVVGGGGVGRWAGIHPLLRMEVFRSLLTRFLRRLSTSGNTDKNKGMVHQLQNYGIVNSSKVAEVMMSIDRAMFVPPGTPPYIDSPMQIGYNATISAPHMHATCLELLKEHLQRGMHALDVGSGTGYLTACFAVMVGPQGRAVGIEHIPELVASSIENIKRSAAAELLEESALSVHVADGRLGWPEQAPYDAIHVGAAAPEVPQALIDQLKPGGRLVIPVGKIFQELRVIDKKPDGSVSVRNETSVRYVPLTSRAAQLNDY